MIYYKRLNSCLSKDTKQRNETLIPTITFRNVVKIRAAQIYVNQFKISAQMFDSKISMIAPAMIYFEIIQIDTH